MREEGESLPIKRLCCCFRERKIDIERERGGTRMRKREFGASV